MKGVDHSNPATKDEWIFAFVAAYRRLRPEIGERYAKTHGITVYNTLKATEPAKAAELWLKTGGPRA